MMNASACRGQSYTEYIIVVMAVAMALLVSDEDGQTNVNRIITAIKQHYQAYATSISLPELPSNR